MREVNSMSRGNVLAQNRRNSLPCTVKTSRQRSYNQKDLKPSFLFKDLALGFYSPTHYKSVSGKERILMVEIIYNTLVHSHLPHPL